MQTSLIHILIVEDNLGDVRLLKEAFKDSKLRHQLHIAMDGQLALDFLNHSNNPRPHLIMLNLNLPRKSGHEVLQAVKQDAVLRRIPIIVLSSSVAVADVGRAYDLHANCFIQKPTDLDEFLNIMRIIEDFWMRLAKLPPEAAEGTSSPQNSG